MRKRTLYVGLMLAVLLVASLGAPGSFVVAAPDNSTLDAVLKKGELVVGVFTTLPPWGFLDENHNIAGYDIDLAKDMAETLGVKLRLIETQGTNRVPYLQSGKVDIIIMCFGNTLERAKSVAFSQQYAYEFVALTAAKSNSKIVDVDSLAGYRVGVERGSSHDQLITPMVPKTTQVLRFESPTDTFLALRQGKVDAAICGASNSAVFVQQNPSFEIKADVLKGKYASVPCMAVRRGDQEWLNWVNLFIDQMNRTGRNQELYLKWFGFPMPKLSPSW